MIHLTENEDPAVEILRIVKELQNGSGFGSIEITLHEGRITQIEKCEKLRFNKGVRLPPALASSTALR